MELDVVHFSPSHLSTDLHFVKTYVINSLMWPQFNTCSPECISFALDYITLDVDQLSSKVVYMPICSFRQLRAHNRKELIFKSSHALEVWESIYRELLELFLHSKELSVCGYLKITYSNQRRQADISIKCNKAISGFR